MKNPHLERLRRKMREYHRHPPWAWAVAYLSLMSIQSARQTNCHGATMLGSFSTAPRNRKLA